MSYTIVDDEGVIQVRASIKTLAELETFIAKLNNLNTIKWCDAQKTEKEKPND